MKGFHPLDKSSILLPRTIFTQKDIMKNPFEIRTELLTIAKDYLDKQLELQADLARRSHLFIMKESGRLLNAAQSEELEKLMPKLYSFDDIIKLANELNQFVQKKSD